MKVGRDGNVREVNVAYKIMKDDHWTHNVVTRPTRKIIKLFEIGDTTFAEDMKAVHKTAKRILRERGSHADAMFVDEWPGADVPDEAGQGVEQHEDPPNLEERHLHPDVEDS